MMRESGAGDNRDIKLIETSDLVLPDRLIETLGPLWRHERHEIDFQYLDDTVGLPVRMMRRRFRHLIVRRVVADVELTPAGLDVTVVERHGDNFSEVLRDTEYLVGYADKEMGDAFYENAKSLKLIQLISAGYDRVNIEAPCRAGVAVCNNGGANSGPVAEHVRARAISGR